MKKLFIFAFAALGMLACTERNTPDRSTETQEGVINGKKGDIVGCWAPKGKYSEYYEIGANGYIKAYKNVEGEELWHPHHLHTLSYTHEKYREKDYEYVWEVQFEAPYTYDGSSKLTVHAFLTPTFNLAWKDGQCVMVGDLGPFVRINPEVYFNSYLTSLKIFEDEFEKDSLAFVNAHRKAFSVDKYYSCWVKFAPGNLQYSSKTSTYRFAASQLEYIQYDDSKRLEETIENMDWIDIFPYTGPDCIEGGWRRLFVDEMKWILNRPNADKLYISTTYLSDNLPNGIIILPDFWDFSDIQQDRPLNESDWKKWQDRGAVFLPCTAWYSPSYRNNGWVDDGGYPTMTAYWLSDGRLTDGRAESGGGDDYKPIRLVRTYSPDKNDDMSTDPDISPTETDFECNNINASYLATGGSSLGDINEQLISGSKSWFYQSAYGARASTSNSEAWLYTPTFDMRGMKSVSISFYHTINYAGDMHKEQTLWCTNNFTGDVTTTQWTQLVIPNYPAGNNWTYAATSIDVPLQYVGENTVFAFRYFDDSSTSSYACWEIKDLEINAVCASN